MKINDKDRSFFSVLTFLLGFIGAALAWNSFTFWSHQTLYGALFLVAAFISWFIGNPKIFQKHSP